MCRSNSKSHFAGLAGAFVVFLTTALATPAFAQYSLKGRRDFGVGNQPVAVLAADYDGDGLPDLLSVDELSNVIGLMKGFGDGTFRRVATVAPGSKPTGAVLVDVNADSHPDLVVSNFLTQDVTVNLGNGIGGFAASLRSPVSATAFGLAVGDWNADGKPDVVTVNTTANSISVLRGVGDGTFANLTQITVGTGPSQVLTGDFNSDGKADLVVVNTASNNVQVWRGDGLGAFTLVNTLATGTPSGPVFAAAADFNADGHPDLVVCDKDAANLKVFIANTTGGFLAATTLTPGAGPRAVVVADLNKDAKLDLIVGLSDVSGVGQVAVLNGNGTGGFAAPVIASTSPVPAYLTTGDFNLDGNLDVVTASLTGDTLSILETTGTGAFLVSGKVQLAAGSFPASIVVADFNADGKPDVATANQVSDNVALARGDGLGGFLAPTLTTTGNLSGPLALTTVDTNHDGKIDLVTVNNSNAISVLQNNGSGTFANTNGISIAPCNGPVAITTGEISGDIHSDIAWVCEVSYHLCTKRRDRKSVV